MPRPPPLWLRSSSGMDSTLDVARSFVQAVQDRNADAAAALCAEDVEVTLPGLPEPFQGKEGVRQMIRMAPLELVQTPRRAGRRKKREDHDAHARARDLRELHDLEFRDRQLARAPSELRAPRGELAARAW